MSSRREHGVAWWRAFFRSLLLAAVLLALAAVLQLVLRPGLLYRLGHWHRALQLTPTHLALAIPLAVAVCGVWATRGRRETRARSAVVVGLCLLSVLALEFQLRLGHVRDYTEAQLFPRLGWWTGEDMTSKEPRWLGRGGVPFSLTPEGVRGRAPTPHRYEGRRVVCLGDSFTWASGVGDEENWTVPAAATLGVPFLNASMHGYGVDQMATVYEERIAPRFDHTEVVVGVILDDAYRACERYFLGYSKPYRPVGGELEPCPAPQRWGGLRVAPELQVWRPWQQSLDQLGRAVGLVPDYRDHFRSSLARIVAAAGSRPVYLLTFSTPLDEGREHELLAQLAREAGVRDVRAIDLSGHYQPDGHPLASGHLRIAAAAAELLGGS